MAGTHTSLVAADPAGTLARRVEAELGRAGCRVSFAGEPQADGISIVLDDEGLPRALARLIHLLPGRSIFPNAILVVDQPETAGGLLGEGFRDVVGPADAGRAVEALVRDRPPIVLVRLRDEIEGDFLPRYVAELRARAKEKRGLVRECIELVRARELLTRRIFSLRKRLDRQSIDELLVQDGQVERYLDSVEGDRRLRLVRLPRFPNGQSGGVLQRREPRIKRAREEIAEMLSSLRRDGLLLPIDKAGQDVLDATAAELKSKPLQGLRECLNVVEREIAVRLALIERIQTPVDVDAIAALEKRCLHRHGFVVLPPGVAVPESVAIIVRSLPHPPAEIYLTYCLDLRDLRLKPCADVLDEVVRDLAVAREPRRARPQLTETGDRT